MQSIVSIRARKALHSYLPSSWCKASGWWCRYLWSLLPWLQTAGTNGVWLAAVSEKERQSYLSKLLLLDKDILMCQCETINRKKVSDLHYFLSPAVLGQQGICKRRQSSQLETSQTHLSSGYRSCSSYGDKRTNKNIASSPHKTLNPSFNTAG